MSPEQFIQEMAVAAQRCMTTTRIPASLIIAQAALESAWGESRLTRLANNLFGIKADSTWTGLSFRIATTEYVRGEPVLETDLFRLYPDWQASIDDHAAFLQGARYAAAFNTANGIDFGYAIAAAGYATDPEYGQKLEAVIHTHDLLAYDQGSETTST